MEMHKNLTMTCADSALTCADCISVGLYCLVFLGFTVPSLVLGAMSTNNFCLNIAGDVPTNIWFFVFAGLFIVLGGIGSPLLYVFVKWHLKDLKPYVKLSITFGAISVVITAWAGFGLKLGQDISICKLVEAYQLMIALSALWLTFVGLVVLAALIALGIFCIAGEIYSSE